MGLQQKKFMLSRVMIFNASVVVVNRTDRNLTKVRESPGAYFMRLKRIYTCWNFKGHLLRGRFSHHLQLAIFSDENSHTKTEARKI